MQPGHAANPCRTCGACCAYFRVSFYWGETDQAPGGYVPGELTIPEPPYSHVMRGTDRIPPRCVALEGEVGHAVRCRIYERRPSPCREFGIQWRNHRAVVTPEALERCNRARAAWGLPPLKVETAPAQQPGRRPSSSRKGSQSRAYFRQGANSKR